MGLFHRLLRIRTGQDLSEVAAKVAAGSQTTVWQLLQPWVGELASTPEAQAFVRVRVRRAVRHQMYRTLERRDWLVRERDDVILDQALAILARQYASRLLAPTSAAPPLRRAA